MIPDIDRLRGKLVEMHGSPDAELTKKMVAYVRHMQEHHKMLTCYYDIRGELSKSIEDNNFFDRVWMIPTIAGGRAQESIMFAANYVDLIVIDDITYIDENLYSFFNSLRTLAKENNICIFLLNQRRLVKNYETGEFIDMPYRYNIVQKYCSLSIDADTEELRILDSESPEYDSFIQYLLDENAAERKKHTGGNTIGNQSQSARQETDSLWPRLSEAPQDAPHQKDSAALR